MKTQSPAALQTLALKFRRFAAGLSTLNENQEDMFGQAMTEDERVRDRQDRLAQIAERTLLENKTYQAPGEQEETLTAEDAEAAKDSLGRFDVVKKIHNIPPRSGI